jgi:hypothetical protein
VKIKTKEDLCDSLNNDLGWRKQELSSLLFEVRSSRSNLPVALRSASLLLYAHWEGFIKNAATNYLIYVKSQKLNIEELSDSFAAVCLKQKIFEFEDTLKASVYTQFVSFIREGMNKRASISAENVIKTQSNLSSTVLKEILVAIGLDFTKFELKANLIDLQLLYYRNNIAHGQDLIMDRPSYLNLHIEVMSMINEINNDIQNAVVTNAFRLV